MESKIKLVESVRKPRELVSRAHDSKRLCEYKKVQKTEVFSGVTGEMRLVRDNMAHVEYNRSMMKLAV